MLGIANVKFETIESGNTTAQLHVGGLLGSTIEFRLPVIVPYKFNICGFMAKGTLKF